MVEWDIPNWFALLIELSIGIPLAVFLSIFFYKKQQKISSELEKIVREQEEFRKRRHDWTINSLKSYFSIILYYLKEIEIFQNAFNGNSENDKSIERRIWGHVEQLNYFIKELENLINQFVDVIDPAFAKETLEICEHIKHFCKRENLSSLKVSKTHLVTNIENFLKKLPNPPL